MSITVNGTNGLTFSDASTQNTAATGFGFKNRIINGAMVIDQRNAGASTTNGAGVLYCVDRFQTYGSTASKFTAQQNAGAVTPPTGFTNYLGITSSSAYSVLSTDSYAIVQVIEGFNQADFGWGTASASSVTLSFKVYSSLTGTFGGGIRKTDSVTYSYPFSYSIPVANTWTTITVVIPGSTAGTWAIGTAGAAQVWFSLGTGTTFSGTAGAWAAGDYRSTIGAVSVVGTAGATFYITGVQLEKGSTATSFDYRPYGTELALCQRYYSSFVCSLGTFTATAGGQKLGIPVCWPTTMRAVPTVAFAGAITAVNVTAENIYTFDINGAKYEITSSGAGLSYLDNRVLNASAEL